MEHFKFFYKLSVHTHAKEIYFYRKKVMRNLLVVLSVLCSLNILSQDTITTKLIIFDQENIDEVTKGKNANTSLEKNALKINPLLILRGEIPIYYERALNNYLSIEAAIGMTFKDYSANFLDDIGDDGSFFGENSQEEVKSNISYKLGLRYYTGGVVLDGFYFSVEYAKRDYTRDLSFRNTSYNSTTSSTFTTSYNFTEETNHSEIKLIVGSQEHYYWDNIFLDYYIGGGIDNFTEKKIKLDQDLNNGSTSYRLETKDSMKPRFYLGIKIGFVF